MKVIRSLYRRARDSARHHLWIFWENQPASRKSAVRNLLFSNASPLFAGTPLYLQWQEAKAYFDALHADTVELFDLQKVAPLPSSEQRRVAVHAHIFYPELASSLRQYFEKFPARFDLFISTPHENDRELLTSIFANCATIGQLTISITPNRGRDLAPMFTIFAKQLLAYDFICHVHTKKSLATNDIGQVWREYLWNGLLANAGERLPKIWRLLENHALVYPQKFHWIDVSNCQWGANYTQGIALCQNLDIDLPQNGFIEFPAGSMFWARAASLAPLLQLGLQMEDFDEERGQTDYTLAHALERMLGFVPLAQGEKIALIKNPLFLNHYP